MIQVSPDTSNMSEFLIIITGQQPGETLESLRKFCVITQSVSNRVMLARADQPGELDPKIKGSYIFLTADIPDKILKMLDEKESLFVSAWLSRLKQTQKKRPGDGLDWDDPRFTPPR